LDLVDQDEDSDATDPFVDTYDQGLVPLEYYADVSRCCLPLQLAALPPATFLALVRPI
jgi:hypothetical protein